MEPDPTTPGLDVMPFALTLGAELLESSPEQVRARLDWHPRLCTANGLLHGGAIMALADTTGGLCAYLNLPDGATGTVTVESKTNFLRAVTAGHVEATSRPLHAGRTVVVVDTAVADHHGRLVARVTQTQLSTRRRIE
ncbi:MAG: PaaI family thioesterase [Acidimicrobiales bacterium]|nr:PaaI family thioesterase [Acidimicrobiales bacterium]